MARSPERLNNLSKPNMGHFAKNDKKIHASVHTRMHPNTRLFLMTEWGPW